jgi:hypothetical protein
MSKMFQGGALVIAALGAGQALAADQTQYQVTGSLAQTCAVTAPPNQTINPASTAVQAIGSPSYVCNFAGNATLRFWTQNGGAILSPAAAGNNNIAQSRPYSFVFDGTALGQLTNASNTATGVVRAILTPNAAQSGPATMQLANPAVIAGTYSDTIFISIAP